jgi:hypothetical protein
MAVIHEQQAVSVIFKKPTALLYKWTVNWLRLYRIGNRLKNKYGALVECFRERKTEVPGGTLPLCVPQITQGLSCNQIRVSMATDRRPIT